MMNEMSYRDTMIVLIMSVIIILAVGFFALVRPKYNTLVADKATYETTKEEWEGIDTKLQQIPTLQSGITSEADEAKKTAEIFVNEAFATGNETYDNYKTNLEISQHMQPFIDDSELAVTEAEISGVTAEELAYYYYEPDVLTYSLLEKADVNGNYAKEVSGVLQEQNYLEEREVAEVLEDTITFTVTGKKENLMTFLTKMKEEEKNAVNITALEINDYTFGKGNKEVVTEQQTDAEGNVTTVQREVDGEEISEMTIGLTFYNATPIDEPDVENTQPMAAPEEK